MNQAAIDTITTKQPTQLRSLGFSVEAGILFITLPSGRRLAYVKPQLGENRFGGASITYEGITTGRKWGRLETYGGKLVENIVQAIARDLLTHAMSQLDAAGHHIVMHIHDEVVLDTPIDDPTTVGQGYALMSHTPPWAEGLPLSADGYECNFT